MLIEFATPCYDAQVVGLYLGLNLFCPVLAAKLEDYTKCTTTLMELPEKVANIKKLKNTI